MRRPLLSAAAARQHEHGIPCGVKLIDATWETKGHSFVFTPEKYPDVLAMIDVLKEAGMELVLWISPSKTAGSEVYNAATWEEAEEYGGTLLARSAWAGSQRYFGIWEGDQSADFSSWAGLPSAIVAGQTGWLERFSQLGKRRRRLLQPSR